MTFTEYLLFSNPFTAPTVIFGLILIAQTISYLRRH